MLTSPNNKALNNDKKDEGNIYKVVLQKYVLYDYTYSQSYKMMVRFSVWLCVISLFIRNI